MQDQGALLRCIGGAAAPTPASLHDSSDTAEERLEDGEAPEAVAQAFASVCGALHCLELVERCASVCINMLYERVARRIDRLCGPAGGVTFKPNGMPWKCQ